MATESSTPRKPVVVRCPECGTINRADLARLNDKPRCAKCRRPLRLDQPWPVTDADFQRVVDGAGVPVLVDFFAEWCGPCHAMAPTLDAFAADRAGEVLVLKLDTDANPGTARRFDIRGIPTLISFRAGREQRRHVGMADKPTLLRLVG
jgi:thioredoxin 2